MKPILRVLSRLLLGLFIVLLGACSSGTERTSQLSQAESPSPNDETAFFFFTGQGLQDFQAAGIVGNLDQESQMNPLARQAGGPGRGIAQWSVGGRWDTLVSYANQRGEDPWALQTQLDFVWYELTTVPAFGLAALQASSTVEDATVIVQDKYEICGTCAQGNRIKYAREALAAYGGRGPSQPAGDYGIAAASAFRYHAEQHVFGRDVDGSLEHWTWTEEGGLADLEFWGNGLIGEPRGYVYDEQQHVFARTDGDQLTHWVWNPTGGVTGPESWGDAGGLTSDPTGFVYGDQQHVFGRSPDGTLAHWWWIPDEDLHYSDWGGDKIIGTPVSFVWGDQQHLFARVEGDKLAHWYWIPDGDDDAGLHYVIWPGTITSDPAGFAYDQEQHVYGRSANGNYEHWSWSADTGVQVDERDEPLVGSPMAYVFGDQRHVVAQSPDNTLAHWWWTPDDGDHYADWGGSLTGHVSAFVIPDLQHIFGRNDDGTLSHWWWDPTGVGFEDWGGTLAP